MKKQSAVTMTDGPIWKRIITFAIPVFIGNVFQQLYNTVDSLIVGNFIGKDALAAVSSSGSLIFLMVGFFNGIAMGAGVTISRYFGAKRYDDMQESIHTDIAFGLLAGILLTIVGVVFSPHILKLIGVPESVMPNSVAYFRTYFSGVITIIMYNIAMGILQAVGDSKHPLYYLIISSFTNVVLDLLFVAVFKWGVASAALATVISQGLSAVLCFIRLIRHDTVYRVYPKKIRLYRGKFQEILSLGIPSGLQNSVISIANVVVQSKINMFDVSAVAGCGAYSKIEGFAFLPITCFSMALTTFVGQNLGAKQYDRAKKGAGFGIICSMLLAETIGVCIYTFCPHLIALFNDDPTVIAYGVRQAHIEALFYCFLAFSHCIAGIMRGAGKARVPMFTMLASWCLLRITYITIAVKVYPDISVVFWAYPLTWFVSSVIFLIYFVKVDWVHGFEQAKAAAKNA